MAALVKARGGASLRFGMGLPSPVSVLLGGVIHKAALRLYVYIPNYLKIRYLYVRTPVYAGDLWQKHSRLCG